MRKYLVALLIKILRFTFNLGFFIGMVFHEPPSLVFILIIGLSIFTFLIGELWILRTFGNSIALFSDFLFLISGLFIIHSAMGVKIQFGHGFLFFLITIALTIEEFVYHNYVQRKVFGKNIPSIIDRINSL
ncbi:hypothetical protein DNHGIG_03200 [Collibacillus ludicampi]|uniref:DUF2512 family protein n=1 Tax=Collibacillus ludicampi TaxID=2771369 RepID=A0AAV4LAQ8_9BACL|nr:DUF2512 family protein [Collibacillus ludicampi]GIM44771.1 hypothetical protein DNHGIG_03200 [Collibacillus ludicampi]